MELHPYLHKVQFYETDGMSIVHHGNHILWMEEARTDFLDQLGWGYEKAVEAGIDFAVYSVSCAYKSMIRFGEGYTMVDSVTGQLRAEGTSVHFFYDRAKGRPVSLKRSLPEVYALLESLVEQ